MLKEITGFSGYFVSDVGEIFTTKQGPFRKRKLSINRYGYNTLSMFNDQGKTKHALVHRVVAKEFIPNPENKQQVNHINGIKTDNRVTNLEWVTPKENDTHARKLGLKTCETLYKNGLATAREVSKIDKYTGEVLEIFDSASHAARSLDNGDNAAILRCCHLQKNTHKGFIWRFKGEERRKFKKKEPAKRRVRISCGSVFMDFNSASDAALRMKVTTTSIYAAINRGRLLHYCYKVEYIN